MEGFRAGAIRTQAPRKAFAWAVSPDGTRIAFTPAAGLDHEIWVMGSEEITRRGF